MSSKLAIRPCPSTWPRQPSRLPCGSGPRSRRSWLTRRTQSSATRSNGQPPGAPRRPLRRSLSRRRRSHSRRPQPKRRTPPRPGAAAPEAAGPDQKAGAFARFASSFQWRSLAIGAVGGLIVLAVVLVARSGLPGGGDGNEALLPPPDENGFIPVDTARVAELMKSVQADPNNPETLFELGEIFFQAGEWQASIDWFTKLRRGGPGQRPRPHRHRHLPLQPGQHGGRRRPPGSRSCEIAPDDPQVHYNLGFLYANSEPQDLEAAKTEWETRHSTGAGLRPGPDRASCIWTAWQKRPAHPTGHADATVARDAMGRR